MHLLELTVLWLLLIAMGARKRSSCVLRKRRKWVSEHPPSQSVSQVYGAQRDGWIDFRGLIRHSEDVFKMLLSCALFWGEKERLALIVLIKKIVCWKKSNLN